MPQRLLFRLIALPPRCLYAAGLGRLIGGRVLLLTTTGRRSGRRRTTPLQYEPVDGTFVVASVRTTGADWFQNVLAHPAVEVRIGGSRFAAVAEPCVESRAIAYFLELRRRRHPWFVGAVMWLRLRAWAPGRTELEDYASRLAVVTINPLAMRPVMVVGRRRRIPWRPARQDA